MDSCHEGGTVMTFEPDIENCRIDGHEQEDIGNNGKTGNNGTAPWLNRPSAITPDQKKSIHTHLVNVFSDWLSDLLDREDAPEGINRELLAALDNTVDLGALKPPHHPNDLFRTVADLTALTQEVKLQGRAFKTLSEKASVLDDVKQQTDAMFSAHTEALSEAKRIAEQARSSQAEQKEKQKKKIEYKSKLELLTILLDLRDRLKRGLAAAENQLQTGIHKPERGIIASLCRRLSPRENSRPASDAVNALGEGYRLTLDRLEEALGQYGISEIPGEGRRFDPHCMYVVDVETTTDVPNSMVLEVIRPGYRWKEAVLRNAGVKVAKAPTATDEADKP